MKDKVIVITGASSGIGAALAEVVTARGPKGLVLAARRKTELSAVADRLAGNTLAVVTDVTVRGDVERLRDRALAQFGQIDVWVGNAGRGITRSVTQLTDADLDDMMATNVKSVLYGIQAVLPHFRDRKRGHLITVSSMLGRISMAPLRSAYSASMEAAQTAHFTTSEWDAYIAAGMAIQNEHRAPSLAHREGREQGLRLGIEALCDAFAIDLSVERKRELQALDAAGLEGLMAKLRAGRRWP
jgi:NAD(P)-dependent dehydrogenase (short-subunit alcohol dehydrogenase family)